MKTFITSLFLIFSVSLAYADFQFKYKDGTTLTWGSYTEEKDHYCTWNSMGQVCVPKKDIASVKEVNGDIPEGARVIEPKSSSSKDSGVPHVGGCTVVDYDSYDETFQRPDYLITNSHRVGDFTYGHGTVIGGSKIKDTIMTITIRNDSSRTIHFKAKDIKVYTIKGYVISPNSNESAYLSPGETMRLSNVRFSSRGISKVVDVKCTSY